MAILFLIAALWICTFAGYGETCFGRLLQRGKKDGFETLALLVVLGHIPVIALGFSLHFFVPLSGWWAAIMLCVGLGLFLRSWRIHRSGIFLLFALAVLVASFASRPIVHGDSGYYGIPAISWIVEEPVVRGLANLDPTYGYNSGWWILSALMSWPCGTQMGAICVSIPFLSAAGLLILAAVFRTVRKGRDWSDWFLVPSFYLWFRQVVGVNTPSPSTDVAANLCMVLAFWAIVQAVEHQTADRKSSVPGDGTNGFPSVMSVYGSLFLAVSTLAASVKISAGLLIGVAIVWIAFTFLLVPGSLAGFWANRFLFVLLGGTLGIQFIHGFLVSGFPLFPSQLGGWLDVPWRIDPALPAATVQRAKEWAQTFGATPEQIAAMPKWRIWIERQGAMTNLIMALLVLIVGFVAGGIVIVKHRAQAIRSSVLLIPASIAGALLVWNLLHAPALRFGAGYAFSVLGCLAAFVGPLLPSWISRVGVALWILACGASMAKLVVERPFSIVSPTALPVSTFQMWKTIQGETINIPDGGFAWLGPRPSTVSFEFNPRLWILRDPTSGKIVQIQFEKDR